ncbi:MAG TPA: hypothetical protein GX528_01930 [Firmicutes bacterium]|nr:hypothetical protein [Bacillota bacterium]
MEVAWYADIEDFLGATLEYLKREEALNNLMLGLALRLRREPDFYEKVHLAALFQAKQLRLAALMTEPENLVIYGTAPLAASELNIFCSALLERNLPMPGVVGPKKLAAGFAAVWQRLAHCTAELKMQMRVLELRRVDRSLIGPGRLRPVQAADFDFLLAAIRQFYKETGLNPDPDREMCRRAAQSYIKSQAAFVWEHQGRVVSLAAKSRATGRGIAVNLVYTPQNLRKRGYATSCVAALSQKLLDAGFEFCTLFADLKNPTANRIYLQIGYEPAGDFCSYSFSS